MARPLPFCHVATAALLALPGCLDVPGYDERRDTGAGPSDPTPGTDAGDAAAVPPSTASLEGQVLLSPLIPCEDAPDDCVGDVWVYVTREDPAVNRFQEPLAIESFRDADLAGQPGPTYEATDLPAGAAWLSGFLDDDGNASPLGPFPDKGDPSRFPTVPLVLEAGKRTRQDLELNVRSPL